MAGYEAMAADDAASDSIVAMGLCRARSGSAEGTNTYRSRTQEQNLFCVLHLVTSLHVGVRVLLLHSGQCTVLHACQ